MLHLTELLKDKLDILYLDTTTFCPYLGETIFRYVSLGKDNKILRVSKLYDGLYALTHELIFGNLYLREIVLQYLEQFIDLGFYNARVTNNLILEIRAQIERNRVIPILGQFANENLLYKHFEEHARAYLSNLFNKFNGFKIDRVETIKIPCYDYDIYLPVVVSTFKTLELIDYFKLTIGNDINSGYIMYPPDLIILLTNSIDKYRYVRVFNLYKNKSSTINMRIYKKIYKRREIEMLRDELKELDLRKFTRHNAEYIPNLWTYQCDTCIMKHICHTYAYKFWNTIFRRSKNDE